MFKRFKQSYQSGLNNYKRNIITSNELSSKTLFDENILKQHAYV